MGHRHCLDGAGGSVAWACTRGGISVCGVAGRVIAGCDGVGLNSTQPIEGKYTSGHANACCCVSLNVSPTCVDGSSTNPEARRAGMPSVRNITVIAEAW